MQAADEPGTPEASIAIVVLTNNRLHLISQCVEKVLARTSPLTREIVIWDNASEDGTPEYLAGLRDPRMRVLRSERNVGQNGYARAFRTTSSTHLIELDDDIVDAPPNWDARLLEAYEKLPEVGFLTADLEDDPHDVAAHHRYRVRPHEYTPVEVNGVALLRGPAGGGCAMTDRLLYDRVGGFPEEPDKAFFLEDAAYVERIAAVGFEPAILADLKVHHTGGPYYAAMSPEKEEFWAAWRRANARKRVVKVALLRVPFVRRLNARHNWFTEPSSTPDAPTPVV
jgi:GT2 family glycosyltransferase